MTAAAAPPATLVVVMGVFAGAFLAALALLAGLALLALRVLAARGLVVLALGSAAVVLAALALVVLAVLRTLGFLAGVAAGASWLASSEAVRLETLAPPSLTRTVAAVISTPTMATVWPRAVLIGALKVATTA